MNDKPDAPVGSFLKWIPVPPSEKVTVTLIAPLTEDGGETLYGFGTKEVQVENGSKLNADSAGEDYTLTNFYTDSALTIPFDYQNTPITEDKTLYVVGDAMKISSSYSSRLNSQEDNITEAHFVLAGQEPAGTPTLIWDASDGTGAVIAKMYEGGATYFVAREGATHIWAPDCNNLLSFCTTMTKIDGFKNLYGVKNLQAAFGSNTALNDLGDIAQLNTSQLTSLQQTFQNSTLPATLDLSSWDVSHCMNFNRTFAAVTSNTELDVHGWVIPEGAIVERTFLGAEGKMGYKSINASNWNINAVFDANYFFAQQNHVESIDITGWDMTKLTSLRQFAWHCYELKELILGEGNYLNLENYAKLDAFSGMYQAFYGCRKLCKFNNTGNAKKDHTLFVRLPNNADMNNTNAFSEFGHLASDDFYIDIDLADSVYESAGSADIQLLTPGSGFLASCNAKQVKFFGNYNDKWLGDTLTSHTNRIINANTTNYHLQMSNIGAPVTIEKVSYNGHIDSIIMDRYVPGAGKSQPIFIPTTLKWVLVSPTLTLEEQSLMPLNTNMGRYSIQDSQLKGYYENGAWSVNRLSSVAGVSRIAASTVRGAFTTNVAYIDEGKEDTSTIGGTLAEFKAAVNAGNASVNFPVGTEIADSYGEENAPLIVAHTLDSSNNADYGNAEGNLLVRKYAMATPRQYNSTSDPNYNNSTIKAYLDGDYYNGCSDNLKAIISDITVPGGTTTTAEPSTGKAFLMGVNEAVYLGSPVANSGEIWQYFSEKPNYAPATTPDGTSVEYFLRTPYNEQRVYTVSASGTVNYTNPINNKYIRPAFFVAKAA